MHHYVLYAVVLHSSTSMVLSVLLSGVSVLSVDLFSFFFHSCLGSEKLSIRLIVLNNGTQQLCECNTVTP